VHRDDCAEGRLVDAVARNEMLAQIASELLGVESVRLYQTVSRPTPRAPVLLYLFFLDFCSWTFWCLSFLSILWCLPLFFVPGFTLFVLPLLTGTMVSVFMRVEWW
jgi:hypothetical protein